MKILDQYFDKIAILTLDPDTPRCKRAISRLAELTDRLEVTPAIRGDELYPANWYRSGNGAWGCLQSHIRVAQDAWLEKRENYLVFEDDVVFDRQFDQLLPEFMEAVPENWDQLYLGGQHRSAARSVNAAVYEPRRINRTHAFAVRRGAIPEFLNHVTDHGDHIRAGYAKHIDHRLEDAHQNRRWVTYTPSWWLVGQGENYSGINGNWHPDKWWDFNPGWSHELPLIDVDREPSDLERKYLHFGWAERPEGHKFLDPFFLAPPKEPARGLRTIQQEAFDCRRLAGVASFEGGFKPEPFLSAWKAPVIKLSSNPDLAELCDYPRNGLFHHRWLTR